MPRRTGEAFSFLFLLEEHLHLIVEEMQRCPEIIGQAYLRYKGQNSNFKRTFLSYHFIIACRTKFATSWARFCWAVTSIRLG